jgi:hypothetical protein
MVLKQTYAINRSFYWFLHKMSENHQQLYAITSNAHYYYSTHAYIETENEYLEIQCIVAIRVLLEQKETVKQAVVQTNGTLN